MWKDSNDQIEELYINLEKIKKFPAICPICKKKDAHIYMHIYDEVTRRGGLWIWCSKCHSFFHGSLCVPKYWGNYFFIELKKLSAIPVYLDEIKDGIDRHTNIMINKYIGDKE